MNTNHRLSARPGPAKPGPGTSPDPRIANVLEMLAEAPLDSLETFLDIGTGRGEILNWLAAKGKKCTGTGLAVESYDVNLDDFKRRGIEIIECNAEHMPFPAGAFDGVIMSHVLEHCFNVGQVLSEVRRVLSDDGWLFIFVPPAEKLVCAGHVNVGWNVGQLMYVLLVHGFDVRSGKFLRYGYNICGFVQKNKTALPPLRGDFGDIRVLHEHGFFPLPVQEKGGPNDRYYGDIKSVNWNPASPVLAKIAAAESSGPKAKYLSLVSALSSFLPARIRLILSGFLIKSGGAIRGNLAEEANNKVNPTILRG